MIVETLVVGKQVRMRRKDHRSRQSSLWRLLPRYPASNRHVLRRSARPLELEYNSEASSCTARRTLALDNSTCEDARTRTMPSSVGMLRQQGSVATRFVASWDR